tara:strand:+ start:45864 stop:46208 length:345 start_codon:yes stop_codon:yes gene_type:complete
MMELKRIIGGTACLLAAGLASAETPRGYLDMPLLLKIQQTVCSGNRDVVFVPVSHDIAAYRTSFAVISMSDPDPDSASIVSEREKEWLKVNGCDQPQDSAIYATKQDGSGGFNF